MRGRFKLVARGLRETVVSPVAVPNLHQAQRVTQLPRAHAAGMPGTGAYHAPKLRRCFKGIGQQAGQFCLRVVPQMIGIVVGRQIFYAIPVGGGHEEPAAGLEHTLHLFQKPTVLRHMFQNFNGDNTVELVVRQGTGGHVLKQDLHHIGAAPEHPCPHGIGEPERQCLLPGAFSGQVHDGDPGRQPDGVGTVAAAHIQN